MKLYAQHNYARAGVSLFLFDSGHRVGQTMFAHRPEWSLHTDGAEAAPLVTVPQETAQMLMQQLWDMGVRPNNGAGSSAQADAMQRHIDFAESITKTLLRKA